MEGRMRIHPHSMLLQELAENLTGEYRKMFAHALRCADCQEGLLQLLAAQPSEEEASVQLAKILTWQHPSTQTSKTSRDEYEPAFAASYREYESRGVESASDRERAPALLSELLAQPSARRELLLRNQERFHIWGLLELLVDSCREESYADAPGCEERAWLALRVADELDSGLYGAERIEDLRGRAWAYIG